MDDKVADKAQEKLLELAQRVCDYFGEEPIERFLAVDIELRALARTALALAGVERRSLNRKRSKKSI